MKKIIITAFTLATSFAGWAGDGIYSIRNIPDSLLKKANVVKRAENIRFEIINTGETILQQHYAITILNEAGDKYSTFVEFYDKLRKVTSVEGTLYDALGNEIKKLKSKEVMDLSAVDDISLMDDNRKKVHDFYYKSYPYTIEYKSEIRFNNSFHFPGWYPQEYENLSVQQSSMTVVMPTAYDIRYRMYNYNGKPEATTEKGKKTLKWSIANLKPLAREPYAPRWHELVTMVKLAPTAFEIEGYKGNMTDWKEFGKFLYQLNKGRDVLPDAVKQKVKSLIAGVTDEKEKVKILYQYMQQNTRYISIQLGLGGWQPFEASFVAQKAYGDCKALSNFMYSLLKEAGIGSLYTLIKAGDFDYYLADDFPSNQFNHAILCVPLGKDSLWLECTSQTKPAGYMGNFTGNRKALLIDESGGTLVNTPRYASNENLQIRTVKGKLDKEGSLNINVSTQYKAFQQDDLHSKINALSKTKVQELLQEELSLTNYHITSFQYQENKAVVPHIMEDLDIAVNNYATITGKRLFILPNLLNRNGTQLSPDEKRKYDIDLVYPYRDVDSIEVDLPTGYSVEAMPQEVKLKTKFGAYTSVVKVEGDKLVYTRIREQYAGRFPATDYEELAKFYGAIYKADRARLVLVKKEE